VGSRSGLTGAEALVRLRVEAPGAGPGGGGLEAAQHPGVLCGQPWGGGEHRVMDVGRQEWRSRGETRTLQQRPLCLIIVIIDGSHGDDLM